MASRVTSLTKSGLKDFFIQRLSALVLMAYVVFIMVVLLMHTNGISYETWQAIFANGWVKVVTLLAVVSLLAHSWVGMWTILTDYVHCAWLMGIMQSLLIIGYLMILIWVAQILWV